MGGYTCADIDLVDLGGAEAESVITEIIIALGAWAAVVFVVLYDISIDRAAKVDDNARAASSRKSKTGDEKPAGTIVTSGEWSLEERHHRRRERAYWRKYLLLSSFGTIAAVVALFFAWKAFVEAHSQAVTANATLHISQRAYIVVSELRQEDSALGVSYFHIIPVIRNAGPTPATQVEIINMTPYMEFVRHNYPHNRLLDTVVDMYVGAPEDPAEIGGDAAMPGVVKFSNLVIGPGSTLIASGIGDDLNTSAGVDATSDKIGRFFYGQITYRDVFGVSHLSKYCFRIDALKVNRGSIIPLQSVCSHWNCIDDDCKIDRASYDSDVAAVIKHAQEVVSMRGQNAPPARIEPASPSVTTPHRCPGPWRDCGQ